MRRLDHPMKGPAEGAKDPFFQRGSLPWATSGLLFVVLGLFLVAGCGSPEQAATKGAAELELFETRVLVDPPEAHVGDRVKVTIETHHPVGTDVLNARSVINTNELFLFPELSPRRTFEVEEGRLTRQQFTVTAFELKEVQVAQGMVFAIHPDDPDRGIAVPSQAVHFVSILNDAEKKLDVPTGVVVEASSPLYEERRSFFRKSAAEPWNRGTGGIPLWVWPLLALALLVTAILFLLTFLGPRKRRAKRRRTYTPVQLARLELKALRDRRHAEEGRPEPFYVELSGIARRYLERQFSINAPEQTTEEFLHDVAADNRLDGEQKDLLKRFLKESDLVKFARATPTLERMNQAYSAAERLVEDTRKHREEGSEGPDRFHEGETRHPTGQEDPS